MPSTLDAAVVRAWCRLSLQALGQAREEIDAINVYPVADGDTGTNLYLTVESAAQAVEAVFDAYGTASGSGGTEAAGPTFTEAFRALAHGALIGARGNSGTILAQLLRGMNGSLDGGRAPDDLRRALRVAAGSAYEAVARPVEGTMLTVATGAADAARDAQGGLAEVVRAAHTGALAALAGTPAQLGVLRQAGVVDAGGLGLVAVLGALYEAVTGEPPADPLSATAAGAGTSFRHTHDSAPRSAGGPASVLDADLCADEPHPAGDGPAFEVIFLLEAAAVAAVDLMRGRLDALGDSLVVVGGDGLWNVHVHVDDVGAVIEAAIGAGRPYRIRVTHFGDQARRPRGERAVRAVVAVVRGDGLAGLCARAGATVVAVRPGEQPASGEIAAAIRTAHAREVVLLPNDTELRHAAGVAAEQAMTDGVRVALIPTRSAVQGLAALAVHEPTRRFDEDVVAMTAAAGATRYAELAVAEHRSWTMAGVCQAGDVLGLIDGDVALIGGTLVETAISVLDRMLAAGGELVTLVLGPTAPPDLADRVESHVREHHLAVDTIVYEGGQDGCPLLVGVE